MPHETSLITTVVAGVTLAFLFGAAAHRFRLPPLVGYLLAGVVVGPHTPGYVADAEIAAQLAELGVILLMFGVGLHFSLADLVSVRRIAVPGALGQMAAAIFLGWLLGRAAGWTDAAGLTFGLALSVASTVVLLKALGERGLVETESGRIAVGWLIVEDLAMVVALVMIPALAGGGGNLAGEILGTAAKVAAFAGVMLVAGKRVAPWLLATVAQGGSNELFRVAVLAIALGGAVGAAEIFGVSYALGAFFAGMVLSETEFRHRAEQDSLPLRDLFTALFFVSVGMLFDPATLIEQPAMVAATVAIIVLGKAAAAWVIVRRLGGRSRSAALIAASLAQIGEFSFILAELATGVGLMPPEARDLVLAGALISIVLNPFVFARAEAFRARRAPAGAVAPGDPPAPVAALDGPPPEGHVLVIGLGGLGRAVTAALDAAGAPSVAVDASAARVEARRAAGGRALLGDPLRDETLAAAGAAAARGVALALPDAAEAALVAARLRAAGVAAPVLAAAADEADAAHLADSGVDAVLGDAELARGFVDRLAPAARDG